MRHWIVLAILAVMAALLIYAPPKPEKGRDDGKV